MDIITNPEQARASSASNIGSGERIGHVNLRVTDLSRAIAFYCDVLGLTVICYGPDIGLPTVFLAFGDYHHHVALNWFYSESCPSALARHSGLNHFAIVYPDKLSLAGAVARLLKHGALIEDARDHGGTLSVYLRDPDDNGIELYYDRPRTEWFDSTGQLVIKSEPFDVRKWLKEVWVKTAEIPSERSYIPCLEVES
jgi:catechol 2,3-dioxygenase